MTDWTVIEGTAVDVLPSLPASSVRTCVTSPPYWGHRDYGVPQTVWGGVPSCDHEWATEIKGKRRTGGKANSTLGESFHRNGMTPKAVAASIARSEFAADPSYFCEKCDAWLGCLGLEPTLDLYVEHIVAVFREVRRVLTEDGTLWLNLGDSYAAKPKGSLAGQDKSTLTSTRSQEASPAGGVDKLKGSGLKNKDLIGVPWEVAFALRNDGWWLRRDVIWDKSNGRPESVKDRPTTSHEYIFLLSKSERSFYDYEAAKEPCESSPSDIRKMEEGLDRIGGKHKDLDDRRVGSSKHSLLGRKRAVGSPIGRNLRSVWRFAVGYFPGAHFAVFPEELPHRCIVAGSDKGDTVLDPFAGAGTTGVMARRLGRDFIGVELSSEYAADARVRIGEALLPKRRRQRGSDAADGQQSLISEGAGS